MEPYTLLALLTHIPVEYEREYGRVIGYNIY